MQTTQTTAPTAPQTTAKRTSSQAATGLRTSGAATITAATAACIALIYANDVAVKFTRRTIANAADGLSHMHPQWTSPITQGAYALATACGLWIDIVISIMILTVIAAGAASMMRLTAAEKRT